MSTASDLSKLVGRVPSRGVPSPMWIHGRCHPSSPTWAYLVGFTLTISCAQCGKPIQAFALREKLP